MEARSLEVQSGENLSATKPMLPYVLGTGTALAALLVVMYTFVHSIGFSLKGLDFLFLYTPARLVVLGHTAQLYNYPQLAQAEATVAHPVRIVHGGMPNVYPPYVAIVMAPLALLPYNPAYYAWLTINSALLVLSLYALEAHSRVARRPAFVARLAAILFVPGILALFQGQSTIWVLAAWVAAFSALRSSRDSMAGAALAASLVKPQYAIPWLLVLLLYRRWKALTWFCACSLVLLVLSVLVFGPGIVATYAESVARAARYNHQFGGFDNMANRGLAALFGSLLPQSLSSYATLAADSAALLLLCVQGLRARSIDLSLGIAAVVALLISPHVLIHDIALALLPMAVALRHAPSRSSAFLVAAVYLGVTAGFIVTPMVHVQLVTLPMILLAAWMFLVSLRTRARVS